MDKLFSQNPAANKALQGLDFEQQFTAMLNCDKNHPFWDIIGVNGDNIYLVNVSYNQISQLTGAKIQPKSDCYAVRIENNIAQLLQSQNYVLTEETLLANHILYTVIPNTGISVKLPDSHNYTLQKVSCISFQKIFTNLSSAYFVGALLYVEPAQISKNAIILKAFNYDLSTICAELQVTNDLPELEIYKNLKDTALTTIKNSIQNDQHIYNALCFGDGIFEDPYAASFIFENNYLHRRQDYCVEITVTTGSGRSKGTYTLAFK